MLLHLAPLVALELPILTAMGNGLRRENNVLFIVFYTLYKFSLNLCAQFFGLMIGAIPCIPY